MKKNIHMLSMSDRVIPKNLINTLSPVIHLFINDCSGSMDVYKSAMSRALMQRKQELLNQNEVNSIIIGRVDFGDSDIDVYNFTSVENMDTCYNCDGGTPLYQAIYLSQRWFCNGKDGVIDLLTEQGYAPRAYVWIWSDGEDTGGCSLEDACRSIQTYHNNGVTVAMVSFGQGSEKVLALGIKEGNIRSCKNSDEDFQMVNAAVTQSSVVASRSSMQITENIFDND